MNLNITQFLEEFKNRGEKIKQEILEELVKSKTVNAIIANENFVRALSTVISTKHEVKKALHKQITSLIKTMEVVTHSDLSPLLKQLYKIESGIENLLSIKKTPTKTKTKLKSKSASKKGKKSQASSKKSQKKKRR